MSRGSKLMFTFSEQKPEDAIAIVRGGAYDKKVLYMVEQNDAHEKPIPYMNEDEYKAELKQFHPSQREKVVHAINNGLARNLQELPGYNETIQDLYKLVKEDMTFSPVVKIPYGSTFYPIHPTDPKKRAIWYIAGQSGSGKSYFARIIAESYRKLFPGRNVYVVSQLTEDPTLDEMQGGPPDRIKPEALIEEIPLDDFKDCLVIFDDYDTFDDKKKYVNEEGGKTNLLDACQKLIDRISIQGRHFNVSMICCTHYLSNYKKTKLLLMEAQYLVFFPDSVSHEKMKYVVSNYSPLSKESLDSLPKDSRWVMIHKNKPTYILSEGMASFISKR